MLRRHILSRMFSLNPPISWDFFQIPRVISLPKFTGMHWNRLLLQRQLRLLWHTDPLVTRVIHFSWYLGQAPKCLACSWSCMFGHSASISWTENIIFPSSRYRLVGSDGKAVVSTWEVGWGWSRRILSLRPAYIVSAIESSTSYIASSSLSLDYTTRGFVSKILNGYSWITVLV